MAILVNEVNCLTAWLAVSNLIVQGGQQENVLITIDNPCDFNDLHTWLIDRNPKRIDANADSIRHVINTIFPYNLSNLCRDRIDLYLKYRSIYLKGANRRWGTYFQRLISFDKHFQNNGVNQLENAIQALNGGSPQHHYIVFHLTAVNLNSNVAPMGSPCWHFGEITINNDNTIDLVAIYRKHDYFNKAFGNFIGLSKLLAFICHNSGKVPGKLIVHSINAFNNSSRNNLVRLIA